MKQTFFLLILISHILLQLINTIEDKGIESLTRKSVVLPGLQYDEKIHTTSNLSSNINLNLNTSAKKLIKNKTKINFLFVIKKAQKKLNETILASSIMNKLYQ